MWIWFKAKAEVAIEKFFLFFRNRFHFKPNEVDSRENKSITPETSCREGRRWILKSQRSFSSRPLVPSVNSLFFFLARSPLVECRQSVGDTFLSFSRLTNSVKEPYWTRSLGELLTEYQLMDEGPIARIKPHSLLWDETETRSSNSKSYERSHHYKKISPSGHQGRTRTRAKRHSLVFFLVFSQGLELL